MKFSIVLGCEIRYVSKDYWNTQEIHFTWSNFSITASSKGIHQKHKTDYYLSLQIEEFTQNIWMTVCPLNRDAISGMNRHKDHMKIIDLVTNKVIFENHQKWHSVVAPRRENFSINSLNTISTDFKNTPPFTLFAISPQPVQKYTKQTNKDVNTFLSK